MRVPPDLTALSQRHAGTFPEAYVLRVLRSGVSLPAHGPAEMPVWGTKFEATGQANKISPKSNCESEIWRTTSSRANQSRTRERPAGTSRRDSCFYYFV
jgi:hypothetical protein